MDYVLIAVGLVLLTVGAELLVRGASRLATLVGVSPIVVGLTVVAFGTSAPELAVSTKAALSGTGGIALGNAVGSNLFNLLVVLGLSALAAPLFINRQVLRFDLHIMILAALLLWALVWGGGGISRWEGGLLLALLVLYNGVLIYWARKEPATEDADAPALWPRHPAIAGGAVLVGLGLLVLGAQWLVSGASALARDWGVSEAVIGLTIIAGGTSLPEAATSIMATIRGERDIAVGNVVGSNIFNILAVIGMAGLVSPRILDVDLAMYAFDIPLMVGVTIACAPIFITGAIISRREALLFVTTYVAYIAVLVLQALDHAYADPFFKGFVYGFLPLAALGLLMSVAVDWRRRKNAA